MYAKFAFCNHSLSAYQWMPPGRNILHWTREKYISQLVKNSFVYLFLRVMYTSLSLLYLLPSSLLISSSLILIGTLFSRWDFSNEYLSIDYFYVLHLVSNKYFCPKRIGLIYLEKWYLQGSNMSLNMDAHLNWKRVKVGDQGTAFFSAIEHPTEPVYLGPDWGAR